MQNMDEKESVNGNGTPRDDRFYTPRVHSSFSSGDGEWITPRNGNFGHQANSDGEFATPRCDVTPRQYQDIEHLGDKKQVRYKGVDVKDYEYKRNIGLSGRDYNQRDQEDEEDSVALDIVSPLSDEDVENIFSYARHGRTDDLERLLDRGIPPGIRDNYGNTLLIIACQNGNKKIAKALLRRGADINSRNFKGNTPLHYCYHYGYGDSLGQYLISKGADSYLRNNSGKVCFDGI